MDIPAHILNAVQSNDSSLSVQHAHSSSPRKPRSRTNLTARSALSSAEDLSTTSDSEEHGYQTDFTSPPSSESCAEDMPGDDVEEFRDREYPQLKGKTYLDHGGTTVSCIASHVHTRSLKY